MRDAARHAEAQAAQRVADAPPPGAEISSPEPHSHLLLRWSASCVVRYRCRIKHVEFCQLIHPYLALGCVG